MFFLPHLRFLTIFIIQLYFIISEEKSWTTEFENSEQLVNFFKEFGNYASSEITCLIIDSESKSKSLLSIVKKMSAQIWQMDKIESKPGIIYEFIQKKCSVVFVILSNKNMVHFMLEAMRKSLFHSGSVFCLCVSKSQLMYNLKNLVVLTEREKIFLAEWSEKKKAIKINSLYHDYHYNITKIQLIGSWKWPRGLKMKKNIQNCCSNIQGANLRIVTVEHEPFVKIEERFPNFRISGILLDIMNAMKKTLKFNFTLYESPDEQFGRPENGTWTGMIGEVIENKADIAMAAFLKTKERNQVVDFTPLFVEGYLAVFYRVTKEIPDSINNYIKAFSKNFFLLICLSYILLTCIWLMSKSVTHVKSWKKLLKLFSEVWFLSIQALALQSSNDRPHALTAYRTNALTMYIFSSFIFSCYTSVLVSFLTVTSNSLPFTSVDELIKNPDYGIVFVAGTAEPEIAMGVSKLPESIWAELLSKKQNYVNSHKEGVRKALAEKVGFVSFSNLMVGPPNIKTSKILDKGVKSTDSMVFQKQSPFYAPISEMLLKMKETGVLNRIKSKYLKEKSAVSALDGTSEWFQIDLQHSWFTFIVVCVGVIISFLYLMLEKMYHYQVNYRKKLIDISTSKG